MELECSIIVKQKRVLKPSTWRPLSQIREEDDGDGGGSLSSWDEQKRGGGGGGGLVDLHTMKIYGQLG